MEQRIMAFTRKRGERPGLFSDLKGKGIEDILEVPVAVMVPMVAMMWADQEKNEAETDLIHAICESSPIFLKPTNRQVEDWITEAEKIIREAGGGDEKACRRAKDALTEPLRQTAFAFAVKVLFADEKVTAEEKLKGEELAEWLGIERSLSREIIKVVSILCHGRDAR
jgi:hypothetical protein